jgi:AraC family transcriptional regulator
VAHVEVADDEFQGAYDAIYGGWLPESGYQPDDRPCFEIYLNDPKQHPEGKHITDICVPVKPL